MIPYKLITNHCFLTIQQNNKIDTESKNSLIEIIIKLEIIIK